MAHSVLKCWPLLLTGILLLLLILAVVVIVVAAVQTLAVCYTCGQKWTVYPANLPTIQAAIGYNDKRQNW